MSESTQEAAQAGKKSAGGHATSDGDEHAHYSENEYPYVAHHFDSPKAQLEAGKLGIWLFLVTEILFFAGLFCAYTIYRARYPEVFYWAHFFLDTKLGALNTIVLILSSLTAAWAVRNAQRGEQKLLRINILVTIACACTFMIVKYFEYSHKGHAGLLPGAHFAPQEELWENDVFKDKHPEAAEAMQRLLADLEGHRAKLKAAEAAQKAAAPAAAAEDAAAPAAAAPEAEAAPAAEGETAPAADEKAEAPAAAAGTDAAASDEQDAETEDAKAQADAEAEAAEGGDEKAEAKVADQAAPDAAAEGAADSAEAGEKVADAAGGPAAVDAAAAAKPEVPQVKMPVSEDVFLATQIRGLNDKELKPLMDAGIIKSHPSKGKQLERPTRSHMFFSIYFFMTGLHGLHVLIGIGIWVWLLIRAGKGQFGPQYFGPIDFAALYWHLVDLIWIYLFPLLYLIH